MKLVKRVRIWWTMNQAPRARVVARSIHRALHLPDEGGSIGGVDEQTMRTTDGGIFGASAVDGASEILDQLYGQPLYGFGDNVRWLSESEPTMLVKALAHALVFVDGAAGNVRNLLGRTG